MHTHSLQNAVPSTNNSVLQRLQRHVRGPVVVDAQVCAQYALTVTSPNQSPVHTQSPMCVIGPNSEADAYIAFDIVRCSGLSMAVAGQSVSLTCPRPYVMFDTRVHLNRVLHVDAHRGIAVVQAGVSLAQLNAATMVHGMCLPIGRLDQHLQTASMGQLLAHNRCDHNVALYGSMVHQVLGVDAVLADGTECFLGPFGLQAPPIQTSQLRQLVSRLFELAARYEPVLRSQYPKAHHVSQGMLIDVFYPQTLYPYTADGSVNLAHVLAGSCGSLAYIKRIHLKLTPLSNLIGHSQTPAVLATSPLSTGLRTLCNEIKHLFDPNQVFV